MKLHIGIAHSYSIAPANIHDVIELAIYYTLKKTKSRVVLGIFALKMRDDDIDRVVE